MMRLQYLKTSIKCSVPNNQPV